MDPASRLLQTRCPTTTTTPAVVSPVTTITRRRRTNVAEQLLGHGRELHDMDGDDGHRPNQDLVNNKPTHMHFEASQTPHVVARVQAVQTLLREDIYLSAYGAPHLPCPVSFQFVPSAFDLNKGELEACLGLVEKTSGHDYKTSSIGWNPRKKREEMLDGEMMYLLVRQGPTGMAGQSSMEETPDNVHEGVEWTEAQAEAAKDPCPVKHAPDVQTSNDNCILGFVSFMFTCDDPPHQDRQVVYIYEIHLDEQLRGQGLGSHLIKFVEDAARTCQIKKTMLTVFTANKRAKAMYESLGYSKDECSPSDRVTRNKVIKADYVIMSKSID